MRATAGFLAMGALAACLTLPAPAQAEDEPVVAPALHTALTGYLRATKRGKAKAELKRALTLLGDDLALAVKALRSLGPLRNAKPGTEHARTFQSGKQAFEYSIHLPAGYDGTKRFPVLVLPDHGAVGPEAGIGFWVGKVDADKYVLFRPVIVKHQENRKIFKDQGTYTRESAIATVMNDALAHLRLHYAVDPARFSMTGLSQAGFYSWYYALSFPDQFAAIIPESAGGGALTKHAPLAPNLRDMHVRILHHPDDQITPYKDAVLMKDAIGGSKIELISYKDSDYPGAPFPKRHPGPHNKRIMNVLPWAHEHKRTIPASVTRVMRYSQQGFEGRWRITPPKKPKKPVTVTCTNEDGVLSADHKGVRYLVSPEDILGGTTFQVGSKDVKPKADIALMLKLFKASGDLERLVAAEIKVK